MQDKGEDHCELVDVSRVMGFSHPYKVTPDLAWGVGKDIAIELSQAFYEAGYHKQVYNRLTEPFQLMKTVITGTEFNNFFWLRDHEAADPTIAELARVMRLASDESTPHALEPGQYHLPYVDWQQRTDGSLMWLDEFGTFTPATWEQLRKVSAARCAAVSFRNTDYNMVKCLEVYDRLVGDERKHASAFEHQATPMRHTYADRHTEVNLLDSPRTWEDGITHIDRNDVLWSGNLRGFIQFRKLIEGENVPG
jgi:hypothetical protein